MVFSWKDNTKDLLLNSIFIICYNICYKSWSSNSFKNVNLQRMEPKTIYLYSTSFTSIVLSIMPLYCNKNVIFYSFEMNSHVFFKSQTIVIKKIMKCYLSSDVTYISLLTLDCINLKFYSLFVCFRTTPRHNYTLSNHICL